MSNLNGYTWGLRPLSCRQECFPEFWPLSNHSEMYVGAKLEAALTTELTLKFSILGEKPCKLIKYKIKCQSHFNFAF